MAIEFTPNTVGITIGCDLGKQQDYTAICVAEAMLNGDRQDETFAVRWLERARLGTDYTAIANRLANLHDKMLAVVQEENKQRVEKARQGGPKAELVGEPEIYIDVTGLGGPFVDFLRKEHPHLRLVAVSITSGDRDLQRPLAEGYDELHVGKEALIGRLQVLLGAERIGIPDTPTGRELQEELRVFRRKLSRSTGHASFEAEEGFHDDLVIATALSVWKRARAWNERIQLWQ